MEIVRVSVSVGSNIHHSSPKTMTFYQEGIFFFSYFCKNKISAHTFAIQIRFVKLSFFENEVKFPRAYTFQKLWKGKTLPEISDHVHGHLYSPGLLQPCYVIWP